MKNTATTKIISRIGIAVLILALVAGTICVGILSDGFRTWNKPTDIAALQDGTDVSTPETDTMPDNLFPEVQSVKLAMSSAATYAADNSVSKTVTATVFPAAAKNKSVDWAIEWVDENAANISEFVTVTPESDGSATATVTCYKPFSGEALITATTREGKLFDTCRVVFVGNPSSLQIAANGLTATSGTIGSYYEIGSGNTYTFDLTPSNVFGQVGAACNYNYSVKGVGSIKVQKQYYSTINDGVSWVDGTEATVNISDITEVSKYYPTIFDCSISGSQLTVKVNCTLQNYYTSSVRNGNVITYENRFREYTDDNWYYEITVTETNSGVSKAFKVRPVVTVTNIAIREDVITF